MKPSKTSLISAGLWIAVIVAMVASYTHVVYIYNSFQKEGYEWVGYVAALALDIGLLSITYEIQRRKKLGHSTKWLWVTNVLFAAVSAYANFLYAYGEVPEALHSFNSFVFGSTLPIIVIVVGEILSSGDEIRKNETEKNYEAVIRQYRKDIKALNAQIEQLSTVDNDDIEQPKPAPKTRKKGAGRSPKVDLDELVALLNKGYTNAKLAKRFDVETRTISRYRKNLVNSNGTWSVA